MTTTLTLNCTLSASVATSRKASEVTVSPEDTIATLKAKICGVTGVTPELIPALTLTNPTPLVSLGDVSASVIRCLDVYAAPTA